MASTQFNSTSIVVDDRDPRITYSGVWSLGGTSGELVSTSHESNVTGSTATLIFNGMSFLYSVIILKADCAGRYIRFGAGNGLAD